MRRLIILLFVLFLLPSCITSHAQTGGLMPYAFSTYLNSGSTAPAANGFLCSYAGGTTTPVNTYQDSGLVTPNHNPIQLNSAGQTVAWGGSTGVSIYLAIGSLYKLSEYTSGTGNTCNGTAVGSLIRTIDNISPSGGGISGSGTIGKLPIFTGTNTLGNSSISHVSLGTPGNGVLVSDKVLIGPASSTVDAGLAGSLYVVGNGVFTNGSSNANVLLVGATGGGAFVTSAITGSATIGPLYLNIFGVGTGLRISTDPFLQLDTSYAGSNLSNAGTVGLRNHSGSLEVSENGGAWVHAVGATGPWTTSGSNTTQVTTTNNVIMGTGSVTIGSNAAPTTVLDVFGATSMTSPSSTVLQIKSSTSTANIGFTTNVTGTPALVGDIQAIHSGSEHALQMFVTDNSGFSQGGLFLSYNTTQGSYIGIAPNPATGPGGNIISSGGTYAFFVSGSDGKLYIMGPSNTITGPIAIP